MAFLQSKRKSDIAYSAVEADGNTSNTDVSTQSSPRAIAGWPTGPQRIGIAPYWIVADVLLFLLPIAFIVLAALAWSLNGRTIDSYGLKIQEATRLGPTIFPLVFAAIAGRSLKRIALWKAETGTTLGFLEHVIGSQTLVSTIGHAIALHYLDFLTVGLLVLWALSPLGGQSSLRMVSQANSTVSEGRSVFYANVDASSEFPNQSYNTGTFNRVNAAVMSSLMTADTLEWSPMDTWNHPKIPRLEELEEAEKRNETDRSWYNVDKSTNYTYASLTGVNVINLSQAGVTNFNIPYEYMYFDCGLSSHNNFTDFNGRQTIGPYIFSQLDYLRGLEEQKKLESAGLFQQNATLSIAPSNKRDFFIYTVGTALKPEALLYGSKSFVPSYWLFECSMRSVMVEADIACETDACRVQRLRRLNIPRSQRNGTHLPYDVVTQAHTNRYFIRHLTQIGGESTITTTNPVDAYLYGVKPWSAGAGPTMSPVHNWTTYINNPNESVQMSHRLTKFLNTFWDASRWPQAMTRNDPFALKSMSLDPNVTRTTNPTDGEPPGELTMSLTQAVVTRQIPTFKANAGWVACLIICSSVLLVLGLVSVSLSILITVPDVFDYVSSFTRDNPFINAPSGGSGLDGSERARLLKNLPVQLGDTDAGSETGYIALRSVEGDTDLKEGRLRRNRMYR